MCKEFDFELNEIVHIVLLEWRIDLKALPFLRTIGLRFR